MANNLHIIFLILLTIIELDVNAQQNNKPASIVKISPDRLNNYDTLDLEFSFPCTAFSGECGIDIDSDDDIYVSQYSGGLFAKYDQSGNILDTFSISGVTGILDMTYDGSFFFGSTGDYGLYVLDLICSTLVHTVQMPFQVRAITYDNTDDAFWISEYWTSKLYKVDIMGNVLDSLIPTGLKLDLINGLAYNNQYYNNYYLWGFSEDSTGAILVKYDIETQSQIGSIIDLSGLADGVAGGLFYHSMGSMTGEAILGGIIQNQLVFALDLDYANQLVGLEVNDFIKTLEIFPNPASNRLRITVDINDQVSLKFRIINVSGQTLHSELISIDKSKTLEFNISKLTSGVYFVQFERENGYIVSKKFIVTK
jgi:hypothetical protein